MGTEERHTRIETICECGDYGIVITAYCIRCKKQTRRAVGRRNSPGIARTMAIRELRRRSCSIPMEKHHVLVPAGSEDSLSIREQLEQEFEHKYNNWT